MTTIWERVTTALAGVNVPKAASVYIAGEGATLPDLYLVYSLVSSSTEQHADNRELLRSYRVQVSIYNRAGLINLPDVTTPMVAAGFMPGPITEIGYSQQTGHYGLAMEFIYLEDREE